MSDCIFCKIVAGEIGSTQVASTDAVVAFRDIDAKAPTHVLVIPRRHIRDSAALTRDDDGLLDEMFATARRVADAEGISEASGGGGYRLVFNNGPDCGEGVPHLHLHVLGGRKLTWPPG